jgi:hypothetical protein
MSTEQKIRAFLFYLAVCIFFLGLPFLLASSLGYKFNPHTLRFARAGLLVVKTSPPGASVFINGTLFSEKTPTSINEVLPGTYTIRVFLEGYYPWSNEVSVEAGGVTRLEKIVLFSIRPDIKQLNKHRFLSYWVDPSKKFFYYLSAEDNGLYRTTMEGEHAEWVAIFPAGVTLPAEWLFAPDGEKVLCFNPHQIAVVYFDTAENGAYRNQSFIFNYPKQTIQRAFWYSDSYHVVVVTDQKIEVIEAAAESVGVLIEPLTKKDNTAFYDSDSDVLYFVDTQKAADGKYYDNLYKIDLGKKYSLLQNMMRLKLPEQGEKDNKSHPSLRDAVWMKIKKQVIVAPEEER